MCETKLLFSLIRLEEMTLLNFNRLSEQCTIIELQQCLEFIFMEDDFIHNEDLYQNNTDLLIL